MFVLELIQCPRAFTMDRTMRSKTQSGPEKPKRNRCVSISTDLQRDAEGHLDYGELANCLCAIMAARSKQPVDTSDSCPEFLKRHNSMRSAVPVGKPNGFVFM